MRIEEEFITTNTMEEYNIYFDGKNMFTAKHDLLNIQNDSIMMDNYNETYNIIMLLETVYNLGKQNIDVEFGIK